MIKDPVKEVDASEKEKEDGKMMAAVGGRGELPSHDTGVVTTDADVISKGMESR